MKNRYIQEKISQFTEMWKKDYLFKTVFSSAFSVFTGLAFTIFNGILGIVYLSLWNGSICVYYLILTTIRAILVNSQRKLHTRSNETKTEYRKKIYIYTHLLLILMNVCLIVPITVMVRGGRNYKYGLIPAIAMATYTTYRITMGIIQLRKSRRNKNMLVSELRAINMIDTLVAILTLQNSLIIATSGVSESMTILSAYTSAGVLAFTVGISIRSFMNIKKFTKS